MHPQILTISSVGQITIPKKIRELLGVKNGDKLAFDIDEKSKTVTFKRQKTHEEIFAELEKLAKNRPEPNPKLKHMTVNEMYDLVEDIEGETWA